MISLKDALEYEVMSSRLSSYVKSRFIQTLIGRYYARKVNKKHARYRVLKNGAFMNRIKK